MCIYMTPKKEEDKKIMFHKHMKINVRGVIQLAPHVILLKYFLMIHFFNCLTEKKHFQPVDI